MATPTARNSRVHRRECKLVVAGCRGNTLPVPAYIGIRVFSAVRSHNIHSLRRNENGYRSLSLPSCISLYRWRPQSPPLFPFIPRLRDPIQSCRAILSSSKPVSLDLRAPRFASFCPPASLPLSGCFPSVVERIAPPILFLGLFARRARCHAASGQSNTLPTAANSNRFPWAFPRSDPIRYEAVRGTLTIRHFANSPIDVSLLEWN